SYGSLKRHPYVPLMTASAGPRRRPPRAARARVAATAVSVAAMLALGGILAWRDGDSGATTTSSVQTQTDSGGTGSSNSSASGSATSGTTSGASSSTDSSSSSGT